MRRTTRAPGLSLADGLDDPNRRSTQDTRSTHGRFDLFGGEQLLRGFYGFENLFDSDVVGIVDTTKHLGIGCAVLRVEVGET